MWRLPGENYKVEVDGLVITFKPLTDGARRQIINRVINDDPTALDHEPEMLLALKDQVVAIAGINAPVSDILEHQSKPMLMAIWGALLSGSTLSEEQAKNLLRSSASEDTDSSKTVTTPDTTSNASA